MLFQFRCAQNIHIVKRVSSISRVETKVLHISFVCLSSLLVIFLHYYFYLVDEHVNENC